MTVIKPSTMLQCPALGKDPEILPTCSITALVIQKKKTSKPQFHHIGETGRKTISAAPTYQNFARIKIVHMKAS